MKPLILSPAGLLGVAFLAVAGRALLAGEPSPAQNQANPPAQQAAPNAASPAAQNAARAPGAKVADAVPFTTKDGKLKGWKVVIPGNRPLATPAVVGGRVFIGGGFGSHEFYAFDARTGKKLWQYQTADDGPTAAVVQDGYVAFNTESCELEIITVEGKPVWKKWLGDPLMSMPAIAAGNVYMAYPDSKGDHQYHLACFDLKTGKEHWKKPIAGEIITAPVVKNDQVYVATLEGTLYCFTGKDGKLAWTEKGNATSSPVVWNDRCYFSRRQEVTVKRGTKDVKQQTEQVAARGLGAGESTKDFKATSQAADYLDYAKRGNTHKEMANQSNDAGVGFAGVAGGGKGSFAGGLARAAQENIGQASVSGIWAYQGSKPFLYDGRLFSAMGDTVQCVDPKTEKVVWKNTVHEKKTAGKAEVLDSALTPPALVNGKAFVGTTGGEVVCLSAQTGEVLWKAAVGEPIAFQPAVAGGRVYVSTEAGGLYSLETGDARDDGWPMWGANAAHNGAGK